MKGDYSRSVAHLIRHANVHSPSTERGRKRKKMTKGGAREGGRGKEGRERAEGLGTTAGGN